jgi:TPR repeat protein
VFMQKGDENLRQGNINLARLFYKRAADAGWAPGAFALAQTYDAHELARLNVLGGIQPDPKLATQWYEKARDLGSDTARQRLGQR